MSPLKAIASPVLVPSLSPQRTPNKALTPNGSKKQDDAGDNFSFRIRSNSGVKNQSNTRDIALRNSKLDKSQSDSLQSNQDSKSEFECGSPVQFAVQNKMKRLQDAKREWSLNHSENSPFPVHKLQNFFPPSTDCGSPIAGGSPMGRGFAVKQDLN